MDINAKHSEEDNSTREESHPFLAYMYFWYETLHPGVTLYTAIPAMPALLSGTGTPEIANQGGGAEGKNIMWMTQGGEIVPISQGGDANGAWFDFHSEWPVVDALSRFRGKAEQTCYALKALIQGKGVWKSGTLANDPQLAAWFHNPAHWKGNVSESTCTYTFPTGAVMEIKRPQDDGVLIYRIRQNRPQYYPPGQDIILRTTAAEILAALYLAKKPE